LEPVNALGLWARKNRSAIQQARQRFDSAGGKGRQAMARQVASSKVASRQIV
jgi:hypothetical protein